MKSEDLAQIRAIVTEAVDAAAQSGSKNLAQLGDEMNANLARLRDEMNANLARLRGEMNTNLAQLRDETNTKFAESREDFRRSLDAAVQSVATDFSQLREEMNTRFDHVNQRFDSVERRLDLTSETMRGIDYRISALGKWADTCDRGASAILATQAAQQRAIDEIVNRLTRIERQPHPDR